MTSTGSSYSDAALEAAQAPADLVVGLFSYQHVSAIEGAIGAVREALRGRFQGLSSRIVVADGGSSDGTAARAREALGTQGDVLEPPQRAPAALLDLPYHGMPGKARSLQGLLGRARQLEARACVLMDAGVAAVSPRAVDALAGPVLAHEVDLVSPHYLRHPYEGALTKGIVRPLVRALYGLRLRQPAAQEIACSRRAVDWLLDDDVWDRDHAQTGIDVWLVSSLASGDFRIAEASCGVRRTAARDEASLDLPTTLAQVVGALFADIEARVDVWQRRRGSAAVPVLGEPPDASPRDVTVDVDHLIESYRIGCRELRDLWTWVLPPRTIIELGRLARQPPASFRVDDGLWARTVYDFTLAHRLQSLAREHLLRSLAPLYLGWLASFILEVRDADRPAVEERLDRLGAAFEAEKPYLIARWRWPERLRT